MKYSSLLFWSLPGPPCLISINQPTHPPGVDAQPSLAQTSARNLRASSRYKDSVPPGRAASAPPATTGRGKFEQEALTFHPKVTMDCCSCFLRLMILNPLSLPYRIDSYHTFDTSMLGTAYCLVPFCRSTIKDRGYQAVSVGSAHLVANNNDVFLTVLR